MIRLENLSKTFAKLKAVDRATFSIPEARITILAGADGAGKSTIFKMILGLEKRQGGSIFLQGENIQHQYHKITAITGYMPERFSLYPDAQESRR